MPGRCTVILTLAVALAGCRRQTGPDANYQKASQLFQQLYATQLDDAYGDPKIDEVVALLKQVDPRSVDAEPASLMLGSIERGRAALAKERADREKLAAAAAAAATSAVSAIDTSRIIAASSPPEDAGPPRDPFGEGALIADINRATGGCLDPGEPFQEQNTKLSGTIYRLARSSSVCADKMPGFVGQAVLVIDGRIYRRIADPNPPRPPAPPPDAGPPRPAPAAQATAPDAGAPAVQYYYPGQPVPGYVPPDAGQQ